MTLATLLDIIGKICINDKMVNYFVAGNSVYDINSLTIKDYPLCYVSPTGTQEIGDNFSTFSLTLFYLDRLLIDNSNETEIHSVAVEVIKNLKKKLENNENIINIEGGDIILFTEKEKFSDKVNGGYINLKITVLNNSVCAID